MKISSIMCCNDIMDNNMGQAILSGPLQIFSLINIPSTFSFSLSIGLLDIKEEETIDVIMKNEKDEVVNKLEKISLPQFPENIDKNSPVGMQFNFNIKNMIFNTEGLYSIVVVSIDKEELVKSYFRVVKQGV